MDYPVQLTIVPSGVRAVVFKTDSNCVTVAQDFSKLENTMHFSYMLGVCNAMDSDTSMEVVIVNDYLDKEALLYAMSEHCTDAKLVHTHLKHSYLVALDLFPTKDYVVGYCERSKAERMLSLLGVVHRCQGLVTPISYTCDDEKELEHFKDFIHDHEVVGNVVEESLHDDWFV